MTDTALSTTMICRYANRVAQNFETSALLSQNLFHEPNFRVWLNSLNCTLPSSEIDLLFKAWKAAWDQGEAHARNIAKRQKRRAAALKAARTRRRRMRQP